MDLAEGQGQAGADPLLRSAMKMKIRFGAHLILDVADFAKMGQQWASLSLANISRALVYYLLLFVGLRQIGDSFCNTASNGDRGSIQCHYR
jgi:hypothetical protein